MVYRSMRTAIVGTCVAAVLCLAVLPAAFAEDAGARGGEEAPGAAALAAGAAAVDTAQEASSGALAEEGLTEISNYDDLIAACANGGRYVLTTDIDPGSAFGKGCTVSAAHAQIDFNGYGIIVPKNARAPLFTVADGAALSLIDGAADGSGGIRLAGASQDALAADAPQAMNGKGAIVVEDGGALEFDCTISGTSGDRFAHAGAITLEGSASARMAGGTVSGCSGFAGAVYAADESTFVMEGGVIEGCSGDGTVRIGGAAAATMGGGTIAGNESTGKAGAIFLEAADADGTNAAAAFTMGGGSIAGNAQAEWGSCICALGGRVSMTGGVLEGTACLDEAGAAIGLGGCIYTQRPLSIVHGTLTGCAVRDGGCIYCGDGGVLTLGNRDEGTDLPRLFGGSAAGDGGGICIRESADTALSKNHALYGVLVRGCTAEGDGGGIFKDATGNLGLDACDISACTAAGDGGGLCTAMGYTSVTGGQLVGNAAARGGGMCVSATQRADAKGVRYVSSWELHGYVNVSENSAQECGTDLFLRFGDPFDYAEAQEAARAAGKAAPEAICGRNLNDLQASRPIEFATDRVEYGTAAVTFATASERAAAQFEGEAPFCVLRDDSSLIFGGIYAGDTGKEALFADFADADYDGTISTAEELEYAVGQGGTYRLERDVYVYAANMLCYRLFRDLAIDMNGYRIVYVPADGPGATVMSAARYRPLFTLIDGSLTLGRSDAHDIRGGVYFNAENTVDMPADRLRASEFSGCVYATRGTKLVLNTVIDGFRGTLHPRGTTTFEASSAGAIGLDEGSALEMRDGRILNCQGTLAGAICASGAHVEVKSGGICHCAVDESAMQSGGTRGGGIHVVEGGGDEEYVNVSGDAVIAYCTALTGSAIALDDKDCDLDFNAQVLACRGYDPHNIGQHTGRGTIYIAGGPSTQVSMVDANVSHCTSYGPGAALYVEGCDASLLACTFTENQSATGEGTVSAGQGSIVRLLNCRIFGNESAQGAGAVRISKGAEAFMLGSDAFVGGDGKASYGSCVYVCDGGAFTMQAGELEGSSDGTPYGGCIYNEGTVRIAAGTVGNATGVLGGCIYQAAGTLELGTPDAVRDPVATDDGDFAVTVRGGHAVYSAFDRLNGYGAGLFVEGGTANVHANARIIDCASDNYGGGVCQVGGELHLLGCLVADNSAQSGAGQFIAGGAVDIADAQFIGNAAQKAGGAMCWSPTESEVHVSLYDGCVFRGNAAQGGVRYGGDDLYIDYLGGFSAQDATVHEAYFSITAAYEGTPLSTAIDPKAAADEPKLCDSYCPECFKLESADYELFKKSYNSMNFRLASNSGALPESGRDSGGFEGAAGAAGSGTVQTATGDGATALLAVCLASAAVCAAFAAAVAGFRRARGAGGENGR